MSLDQSTFLPQASHASPSRVRVSAEVMLMLAGSGGKSTGSFNAHSPLGSCVRTLITSSIWGSTTYSLTWTVRATKRGRFYFRLQPLVRRTSGSESSSSATLWVTPTADAAHSGASLKADGTRYPSRKDAGLTLVDQVRIWPTPTAWQQRESVETWQARREQVRADRHNGDGFGMPLDIAVQLWPTPRASANENRTTKPTPSQQNSKRPRGRYLAVEAAQAQAQVTNWPTPTTRDFKDTEVGLGARVGRGVITETLQQTGAKGRLNPEWVCLLQGFPPGWTQVDWKPKRKRRK